MLRMCHLTWAFRWPARQILACPFPFLQCYSINTIKDELLMTFLSLKIIVYPAILDVYLFRFEISSKVQPLMCYQANII
jgi:hypothetical protein